MVSKAKNKVTTNWIIQDFRNILSECYRDHLRMIVKEISFFSW